MTNKMIQYQPVPAPQRPPWNWLTINFDTDETQPPDVMKYEAMVGGKIMIEKAKMSGIIPAMLTRNGIWLCPCCLYNRPPRNDDLAYCTGTRRVASWK